MMTQAQTGPIQAMSHKVVPDAATAVEIRFVDAFNAVSERAMSPPPVSIRAKSFSRSAGSGGIWAYPAVFKGGNLEKFKLSDHSVLLSVTGVV